MHVQISILLLRSTRVQAPGMLGEMPVAFSAMSSYALTISEGGFTILQRSGLIRGVCSEKIFMFRLVYFCYEVLACRLQEG